MYTLYLKSLCTRFETCFGSDRRDPHQRCWDPTKMAKHISYPEFAPFWKSWERCYNLREGDGPAFQAGFCNSTTPARHGPRSIRLTHTTMLVRCICYYYMVQAKRPQPGAWTKSGYDEQRTAAVSCSMLHPILWPITRPAKMGACRCLFSAA